MKHLYFVSNCLYLKVLKLVIKGLFIILNVILKMQVLRLQIIYKESVMKKNKKNKKNKNNKKNKTTVLYRRK